MKSNYVLVLDTDRIQQTPVHPAVARQLLRDSKAAVLRRQPFTIILKSIGPGPLFVKPLRLKIDPGSKTTGIVLLDGHRTIWAAELTHRGQRIKDALESRRSLRRGRRNRKTRYRKPRFMNRRRPDGWLAPSLMHRVYTVMNWVQRLCILAPVRAMSIELVRFDMQLIQNPEISGVEYQRGELADYELRQYLLEKYRYACAYCSAKDTPLEKEHVVPRSKGGSNRASNLVMACMKCNQKKNDRPVEEFLKGKPDLLRKIKAGLKAPLKDAAAVNATRWRLWRGLKNTGHPLETGTGGRTKWNRTRQKLSKTHWLDAACVGASTPRLHILTDKPLLIKCVGHGKRQLCKVNKYGFPRAKPASIKRVGGYSTGDIVAGIQSKGKYAGRWIGRISGIRKGGNHSVKTLCNKTITIRQERLKLLQRGDGYSYS